MMWFLKRLFSNEPDCQDKLSVALKNNKEAAKRATNVAIKNIIDDAATIVELRTLRQGITLSIDRLLDDALASKREVKPHSLREKPR